MTERYYQKIRGLREVKYQEAYPPESKIPQIAEKLNDLHIDCPKHNHPGTVQIRIYCLHWQPTEKKPKMCLVSGKYLAQVREKIASNLRLRKVD